jgi:predicted DNA-binding protein
MAKKTNTRVTMDIPTVDHKKLKMLAAFHGKSMREIVIELIEHGLEHYQECPEDHTPNDITKKALENVKTGKGLKKAATVEELFKKLGQ